MDESHILQVLFAPSYWSIAISILLSCVSCYRRIQFAGSYFASSSSCFCPRPQAVEGFPVLCQAIGEFQFAGVLLCVKLLGNYNSDAPVETIRFIRFLEHAKPFLDSTSSYILDRPPPLAIPVHHNSSETRTLTAPCQFIMCSYILHAPLPDWAIPDNHVRNTPPLLWRFRFIYISSTHT